SQNASFQSLVRSQFQLLILNIKQMQQIDRNDDFTADESKKGNENGSFRIKLKQLKKKDKQPELDKFSEKIRRRNFPHLLFSHKVSPRHGRKRNKRHKNYDQPFKQRMVRIKNGKQRQHKRKK